MIFDKQDEADGLPAGGLILSRLRHEAIVISEGGRIVAVVELVDAAHDRVRLRVRAPREVIVDRAEVFERRRAAPATLGATQ